MLDLRAEYANLKPDIDDAIARVIASGRFTLGPELLAFERAFAAYIGQEFAIGVGSGTAALHLSLLAAGIGPGDDVITAANTDVATTMAITQAGARVVLADVDPRTFTLTAAEIEARLTPQTRAVIPVHLFGQPADMGPIMAVAAAHDLIVIEDATLAVGAEHRGRRVGTFGLTGCYSFSPGKILGSYGDGGAITTDDPALAEHLRVLRNYGHDPSMTDETGSSRFGGLWKIAAEGFNDRLDTIQAAVLSAKLPTLDDRISARRRIAQAYNDRLSNLDLQAPPIDPADRHVFRAYTVLVDNRDEVRAHLAAAGISTLIYYAPPVHLQPAYAYLNLGPGSFPVTESIADRMMALPVFPEMTEEQVDRVVTALTEVVPPA